MIVQDIGVLKLVREIAPSLEIHASTQMSVSSADGVRFAQSLGASRVTLARELSLDQVRAIRDATDCELEISSTAPCVWPTPASASLRKPGADAAPIADSARRPAGCRMN